MVRNSCLCESLLGAWMNRKNDWHFFGHRIDRPENMGELLRGIYV